MTIEIERVKALRFIIEENEVDSPTEDKFYGIDLEFAGFSPKSPKLLQLNLSQFESKDSLDFLDFLKLDNRHPEEMLAILDKNDDPRLILVKGSREIWSEPKTDENEAIIGESELIQSVDYLHIYKVNQYDWYIRILENCRWPEFKNDEEGHFDLGPFIPSFPELDFQYGKIEIIKSHEWWSIEISKGIKTD